MNASEHKVDDAALHIAATLMGFFQRVTHMSRLFVSRPSAAADWLVEQGYAHHGKSSTGATLTARRTFNGRTDPGRALYLTDSGKAWANEQRKMRSVFGVAPDVRWPTRCALAHAASLL